MAQHFQTAELQANRRKAQLSGHRLTTKRHILTARKNRHWRSHSESPESPAIQPLGRAAANGDAESKLKLAAQATSDCQSKGFQRLCLSAGLLTVYGNNIPRIMKKNIAARMAAMGTVMIQAAAIRSSRLRLTNSTRCTRPKPRLSCFPSRRSDEA